MAGNLKEVRERIKSVISTQQITKAMKMVSAAKFRKAQTAIVDMRPYADRLNTMLGNILANAGSDLETDFGKVRDVKKVCMVVVTSSKGLCGAFNTNIIKAAVARIHDKYEDVLRSGNLTVLCIGKKGNDYFRKHMKGATVLSDQVDLFTRLRFEEVEKVANQLMEGFSNQSYDVVEVAYGRFKNAATQVPEVDMFLPVIPQVGPVKKARADYIFEPDTQGLLNTLIPSILRTSFFKYTLDTHASEHGARMTAMDKATENAEEMLKDLRISYNKARQEAITRELSEIVGGAAALESA
ncbi:MAG: ATP synthase F1 subunit gamma [Saprospiraceae bacterium]|jgi:F-type H+-transporting ATPase subunit gamma|nr:ATP synthase F1 subunit gamma [Saprospiraceae bacterium]